MSTVMTVGTDVRAAWDDALLRPKSEAGTREWNAALQNPGSGIRHTEYGVFNPESAKKENITFSDQQTRASYQISGDQVTIGVQVPAGQQIARVYIQTDGGGFGVRRPPGKAGTLRTDLSQAPNQTSPSIDLSPENSLQCYTWKYTPIHPGEKRFLCVEYAAIPTDQAQGSS